MNLQKIVDAYQGLNARAKLNNLKMSQVQAFNKKYAGALDSYFNPSKEIQAYSLGTTSDISKLTNRSYDFITDRSSYDNGWEQCFKKVPLAEGTDSWQVATGSSAITFERANEGENFKLAATTGSVSTVYVYKYGMALGFTEEMIKFRKIAAMLDLMEDAREAYWSGKATVFYNLLVAAAATNTVTWQGAATDSQIFRDRETINTGAVTIGNNMQDKVANAANAPLKLLVHPDDRARVEACFSPITNTITAVGSTVKLTSQPIAVINTFSATSGYPTMVYPGRKNQYAEVDGLKEFRDSNILNLTEIRSYRSYMGGTADTDQTALLTLG